MTIAQTSLELIGNTPLVLLKGPSAATGCEIWGKCEYANPGGSVTVSYTHLTLPTTERV